MQSGSEGSAGLQLIRAADHIRMPWKNGGGETVEIAIWPPGATVANFDWRLSMATVATDGPFSLFPGIDRTLLVLDGEGIALTVGETSPMMLAPSSAPHAFAGDVAASATLVSGPITDLNVMTRRDTFRHRVAQHTLGTLRLDACPGQRIVFCCKGAILVRRGVAEVEAGEGDTVVCGAAGAEIVSLEKAEARVIVVDLVPVSPM
jgi:environmental stress-induced protein Ves